MRFRKKPVVIEAITFDELVAHGKAVGAHCVNGLPWSFRYEGHPITHETDDCYLIPTLEGTMRFERGDMLITGVKGEIYPCKADIFAATYDPVTVVCPSCGGHDACATCGGSGGGDDGPHVCPGCGGTGHCQDCTGGKIASAN